MNTEVLRDKFRGALLGTFVGDAVGVPVEGFSHDQISDVLDRVRRLPLHVPERREAERLLGLLADPDVPDDSQAYSDDTQMIVQVRPVL